MRRRAEFGTLIQFPPPRAAHAGFSDVAVSAQIASLYSVSSDPPSTGNSTR